MAKIEIYRKRFIPNETILLKDDILITSNDDYLLTSWTSLKPRKDLAKGASLYLFKENIKISKFYGHDGSFLCWYCDVVDYETNEMPSRLTVVDLLADIVIKPDFSYSVLDLDELALAKEQNFIDERRLLLSLRTVNHLLNDILLTGRFPALQEPFDDYSL